MPCSDSSSRIVVRIGADERLAGFDYQKITCGKAIGGDDRLERLCAGRSVDDLIELDFRTVLDAIGPADEESDFLLYLQWDALSASLRQYAGLPPGAEEDRYRIASIEAGEEGTVIRQVIRPPAAMPKIRSCASAAGAAEEAPDPLAARAAEGRRPRKPCRPLPRP